MGLAGPCGVQTPRAAVSEQAHGEERDRGQVSPPGASPTTSTAARLHSQQVLQLVARLLLPPPEHATQFRSHCPSTCLGRTHGEEDRDSKVKENQPPSPLEPTAACECASLMKHASLLEHTSLPENTLLPERTSLLEHAWPEP